MKNVFVVGLDPFNRRLLEALPQAHGVRFHALLDFDEVRGRNEYPVEALLARCERRLAHFDGSIDAFMGFLDFPVSLMLPLLCQRYGTPGPSFESMLRCEHKLWSRMLQQEVIADNIPHFVGFDPHDEQPLSDPGLSPPFWIKPIKSFQSYLAFLIHDQASLAAGIQEMRRSIAHLADPFNQLLDRITLPEALAQQRDAVAIAEGQLSGSQHTVEGYVFNGEVTVYGVVDSIQEADSSSFHRYEYPSRLPAAVQARMARICERLMPHLGYDYGAFNVEFFHEQDDDHLWLLEVNSRHSQSHAYLFQQLHGAAHHQVAFELALGQRPAFPALDPEAGVAAKFMLRTRTDAFITGVPTLRERAALTERFPDAHLEVLVRPGQRLSDLAAQDSYSYEVADLYLSAKDAEALDDAYRVAVDALTFRVAQEVERPLIV
ncbi:ATP-grasp domain-containing protein [Halomonas piscis]|uniref:ATP-grasp domain-containing protein n=1 Tax=Halomonas piscis TaxID=3031727 RepID=UPI00289EAC80|nr:ATP-grasp domain-containing protein [Halomonas piscis]